MELPNTHALTYGIHTHMRTHKKKKVERIEKKKPKKIRKNPKKEVGSGQKERKKTEEG